MTKAIILTDGKAGHENQSKAFARSIGCDYTIVPIEFKSKFHKSLSYLFDKIGIRSLKLFKPILNCPATSDIKVVIGTGSGTFYGAKALAKKLGAKDAVILFPRGYNLASFDCILAPSFDNPPEKENIIAIPVTLVASYESFYAAGVEAFKSRYTPSAKDAVAVIIGGPNKCSTMSADWMAKELNEIFDSTSECEHWVTTSRRTPKDVEEVVDSFPFDFKLIYSRDKFNPIPAFVKMAKKLYVTAESTGMLSEACSFGASQVYALDNLNKGNHKFRRFVQNLKEAGFLGDSGRKADLSPMFKRALALLGLE